MFKVGDEVVCVDASKSPKWPNTTGLVESDVYTIRRVVNGGKAVQLIELLSAPERVGAQDRGFLATRFRKVQRKNSRLTLEAFFTVPGGFEEPKRAPAKKKTDA